MNLLWRLIRKKVEEAIELQISIEMAKRVRTLKEQLDTYRKLILEAREVAGQYAEVFKGFKNPNQYMNFIIQTHPSLLRELQEYLMMQLQVHAEDIVFYVDNTIKLNENKEYELRYDEIFVLGAIAFKTKVTGNITIWRGHRIQTVFKQAAVKESWLPIFTWMPILTPRKTIFQPHEMITVNSPGEPILYVIKAERRGRTIS